MTHRRWNNFKIPLLIGLVGQVLFLSSYTFGLLKTVYDIAFGDPDSETRAFSILAGIGMLFVALVVLVLFVISIKYYRRLIIEGTALKTASEAFKFHLGYGVVFSFLFHPRFTSTEGLVLTSVMPIIMIVIPYLFVGITGLAFNKK